MIIYLRLLLPASWSDLPVHHMMRTTSLNLFDLAPGGVYKLILFEERLVVSYTTFSPLPYQWRGGIFSVALSMYLHTPWITRRSTLRCSDFPLLMSLQQTKSNYPTSSNFNNRYKLQQIIEKTILIPNKEIDCSYHTYGTLFLLLLRK